MSFRAPIDDIVLALNEGGGLSRAVRDGHYGDYDPEMTAAVLEEAGKFAEDVLAPLNSVGDKVGVKLAEIAGGGGPASKQRMAFRRLSYEEGAWLRQAVMGDAVAA